MGQTGKVCLVGALIGAAAGAAVSFLYATEEGAEYRASFARFMDRALIDAEEARRLYARAQEAWHSFNDERRRFARRSGDDWRPEGVA
ncbi:MAG: hypothetical protein DIU54_009745 [Acidobacteriota bacterium]|jgi:gas vesicle protein|nr:MAG: hypothetical protein DIU54_05820 [Acidobacteriota bacterium]